MSAPMNAFINAFLLTYAALFPIVNPIGNAPLILSLTRGHSGHELAMLARRVAIGSFFLLLGSLVLGSPALEFFGLSLPIVRIGGGFVVAAFGWRVLNSGIGVDDEANAAHKKPRPLDAFYPFTMPLTVGPGSMSVAIALGTQHPPYSDPATFTTFAAGAVCGILAICTTIYLSYRFAEKTVSRLGPSGTNVLVRLMAFILLCIGLQIVWHGWQGLMALPR